MENRYLEHLVIGSSPIQACLLAQLVEQVYCRKAFDFRHILSIHNGRIMVNKDENYYRRRALDRSNSTGQLNRIYKRDGGICQICFMPCVREDASRDHIKELVECESKEEARDDNNIRLAHKFCNNLRSNGKIHEGHEYYLEYLEDFESNATPLTHTMADKLRKLGF